RRTGCAGLVLALRREQRTLRSTEWIRREFGSALEEGGPGSETASSTRSSGGLLEIGRNAFVESRRRLGAVPGPAIGIVVGIGCRGQGTVHALALLRRGRAVHRRANQRMSKAHLRAKVDQAGF